VTVAVSKNNKNNLIVCDMDSAPKSNIYRWKLNTTAGAMKIDNQKTPRLLLSEDQIRFSDIKTDLGNIFCWAENNVGESPRPCKFNLVAAGLPGPPEDCHVTRETNDSLIVVCSPGWSGGLHQSFHLELWDGDDHLLIRNLTQKRRARFELDSLQSGRRLIIKIYSANKKGRSSKMVELESSTSKVAQLQIETKPVFTSEKTETFMGMFAGAFIIVVFVTVAIALIFVRKMRSLDGSGGTGLQPEPHPGNEALDTEYLHMSGPDTGHVTSGSEHVGPGNTLTDLQNESVIFSSEDISITTKVKPVDHERNPDFSRGEAVGHGHHDNIYQAENSREWHPGEFNNPNFHMSRTNVKLNPLFHQYS